MAVTAALVFAVAAGGTLAAQRVESRVLSLGLNAASLDINWQDGSIVAKSDSNPIEVSATNIMPGGTYALDGADENYTVKNVMQEDGSTVSNLPAYIRVTVTKYWCKDGEVAEKSNDKDLTADSNLIILKCNENGWIEPESVFGNRTKGETQVFYYEEPVSSGEATTKLLESLSLSTAAGNKYSDRQIYLEAEAEAVQFVPGDNELNKQAILSAWGVYAELDENGNITAISN